MAYADNPSLAVSEPRMALLAARLAEGYRRKTSVVHRPWIHLGFCGNAPGYHWFISIGSDSRAPSFRGATLAEAVAAIDAWLAHDEAGDVNETLGLTRDGRLPEPEPAT